MERSQNRKTNGKWNRMHKGLLFTGLTFDLTQISERDQDPVPRDAHGG